MRLDLTNLHNVLVVPILDPISQWNDEAIYDLGKQPCRTKKRIQECVSRKEMKSIRKKSSSVHGWVPQYLSKWWGSTNMWHLLLYAYGLALLSLPKYDIYSIKNILHRCDRLFCKVFVWERGGTNRAGKKSKFSHTGGKNSVKILPNKKSLKIPRQG